MKYTDSVLNKSEIDEIRKKFGDYVKITADLENKRIVIGCELHADGEKVLIEKGGKSDNIWGGGFDFKSKLIDTIAVLNFRPRLRNNAMEILDTAIRQNFTDLVSRFFNSCLNG